MTTTDPFVSIVTPVHNGAEYLDECIRSVVAQTYQNWEYVIVDNCSTDSSVEIAAKWTRIDSRIRLCEHHEFLGVIGSYNRALRTLSPDSAYCKLLAADDWLFPDCLSRMVEYAVGHPAVGVVGSYALSGGGTTWKVKFDGLPYSSTVVSGHEICRRHLLGRTPYCLGIPSSVLYRADLLRGAGPFFPNAREHADVSAFYACLQKTDFGFIHQVLSFERIHGKALSAEAHRLSTYFGSHLLDVLEYGPIYLTQEELTARVRELRRQYYRMLADGVFNLRDRSFWDYHKDILVQSGAPLSVFTLSLAVCRKLIGLLLNPRLTLAIMRKRLTRHPPAPAASERPATVHIAN